MDHPKTLGVALTVLVALPGVASAQIVTDGTLGAAGSVSANAGVYDIAQSLGETSGDNLFHSFSEFSVAADTEARFSGDASLANIIARVTGADSSSIAGLVSVAGPEHANLFLLNPSGIVVSEGGAFDVPGSLYLSTAQELHFGDGSRFAIAAVAPNGVLSVAPPEAFGFVGGQGDINFDHWSAVDQSEVHASGANISVSASHLTLGALTLSAVGQGAADVDIAGAGASPLTGALTVSDASTLQIGQGGALQLNGAAMMIDSSRVQTETAGSEDAGLVSVHADALTLRNGAVLGSVTHDLGNAGDVEVSARSIVVENSLLRSDVGEGAINDNRFLAEPTARGNGGDVHISAYAIEIADHGEIRANTFGAGNAGSVFVVDAVTLNIKGAGADETSARLRTGVFSVVGDGASGSGGDVFISSDAIDVDGGIVSVRSYGTSDDPSAGPGNIFIGAASRPVETLTVQNRGVVSGTTFGGGDGGDVTVYANTITLTSASIASQSGAGATGTGGDLRIFADTITISADGAIETATVNTHPAGSIAIATDTLVINGAGSRIASDSRIETSDAGAISIQAHDIAITNGGRITTNSVGAAAGEIELLIADDGALLCSLCDITTSSAGDRAGEIFISHPSYILTAGARIFATGPAAGAFVTFDTPLWIDFDSDVRVDGAFSVSANGQDLSSSLSLPALPFAEMLSVVSGRCASTRENGAESGLAALPIGPYAKAAAPSLAQAAADMCAPP